MNIFWLLQSGDPFFFEVVGRGKYILAGGGWCWMVVVGGGHILAGGGWWWIVVGGGLLWFDTFQ